VDAEGGDDMISTELIVLNLEEIRRRSIKLWTGIPEKFYNWQPDQHAMTIVEMVGHVLDSEYAYHKIIENRGTTGDDYQSPWENRLCTNIMDELEFAMPYRQRFLEMIHSFSSKDLTEIEIVRVESGQRRKLGDFLLRIAYHEAVHTGQMLSYLRTLGVDRPKVWD
jgi:uncharacterized damage-inducible protein DinB